jgi:hypothetical protein
MSKAARIAATAANYGGDKMSSVIGASGNGGSQAGLLAKEHTIVGPGYNRWLVPPAALGIHLCIGMAYGFSVFWLPLSRAIGITAIRRLSPDMSFLTTCSPRPATGRSANSAGCSRCSSFSSADPPPIWGGWLERVGPRKAGVVRRSAGAAVFSIGASAVYTHQLWMMWLGSGVHRRHRPRSWLYLAGLDADQMVPGPPRHGDRHGDRRFRRRRDDRCAARRQTDAVVCHTDLCRRLGNLRCHGRDLFRVHDVGAFGYRLPAAGWKPEGWTPPPPASNPMITQRHVHLNEVHTRHRSSGSFGGCCA